jgi:hypothetical protein
MDNVQNNSFKHFVTSLPRSFELLIGLRVADVSEQGTE